MNVVLNVWNHLNIVFDFAIDAILEHIVMLMVL